MNELQTECYIVVDVEAAGPTPSQYALLSIGACALNNNKETFYIELKPDKEAMDQSAMAIHSLSFGELEVNGEEPESAMSKFAEWINQVTPKNSQPVFTAFNAPFDWMFINEYFHRYLGNNPFGHKAIDIKAYYMGLHGTTWENTSHYQISNHYSVKDTLSHNALEDAIQEAELFYRILRDSKTDKEGKDELDR